MAHKVNSFLTKLLHNIEKARVARVKHQIKALGYMQNVD